VRDEPRCPAGVSFPHAGSLSFGLDRQDPDLVPGLSALKRDAPRMAAVAVPRNLFRAILERIQRLGSPPPLWVPG